MHSIKTIFATDEWMDVKFGNDEHIPPQMVRIDPEWYQPDLVAGEFLNYPAEPSLNHQLYYTIHRRRTDPNDPLGYIVTYRRDYGKG